MIPVVSVYAAFDLPVTTTDVMTLDDPVRGLLDTGAAYVLVDPYSDLSGYTLGVNVRRGRASPLFEDIPPGTCTVILNNRGRTFDPAYSAGPFFGQILPGIEMYVTVDDVVIFTGRVQDWNFDYDVDGTSIATAILVDGLGVLGGQEFDEWTTIAGQLSGDRISAILDRTEVSWPSGSRDIDAGNSTLQADVVSWGSNVLNYAQLVARSELGYLFADRGNAIVFVDRFAGANTIPLEVGLEPKIHGLTRQAGAELLYNRVGIDREGGIQQTATDTASADLYGWKSLSQTGLLLDSDEQSAAIAGFLIGLYNAPTDQIDSVAFKLHGLEAEDRAALLAVDIAQSLAVTFTPNDLGSAIEQTSVVQGVDHDLTPSSHVLTFHMSRQSVATVFTLDDDTYGLLDDSLALLGF